MQTNFGIQGRGAFKVFVAALAVFTSLPASAQVASETLDNFITTDGVVYAMTETNNILYIGGLFSAVGTSSGGGVPVSATGQPESEYPKFNGYVSVALPDGQGGCYVGGSFTRVGNYRRTNIVHILSDRTVDPSWSPDVYGFWVGSMALSSNVLYFGGNFTNVDGQTRNRLAAVDATTGQLTSWNPNPNSYVRDLVVYGTNVYVGGEFTTIGGQSRSYLAGVSTSTGLATAWNPQCNDSVEALKISNDRLFVGGYFNTIGGQTRSRAAYFNLPDETLQTWNPNVANGLGGVVFSIAISENTVFLGGSFSTAGSSNRLCLAAIDSTSGLATPWDAQLDTFAPTQVAGMELIGNTLYIGGLFSKAGGQNRYYAAALDVDTAGATSFDPKVNFVANVFCTITNGLFLGGSFSCVGTIGRTNLAAFNLTTGEVTSWNPVASTNVHALKAYGDKMYLGGEFKTVNGVTRSNLASVDITTGALSSWAPNPNLYVTSLATWNNRLYAGGGFTNVFGVGRTNLAEFDLGTGNLTSWNPALNRAFVQALAINGNTLYAGGLINTVAGVTRRRVIAFDLTSGTPSLTSWDPLFASSSSTVEAIVPLEDRVYISGRFTAVNGLPRTNIVCVDAITAQVLPFSASCDLPIMTMAVVSNSVFVGGDFNTLGANSRAYLGSVDATTGTVSSWNPRPSSLVREMLVVDNVLYVGGFFYYPQTGRGIAAFPLAMSTPSINPASAQRLPGGSMKFEITAPGATRVTVFGSTNLTAWESLLSVPLTNGVADFSEGNATFPERFYRVTVP